MFNGYLVTDGAAPKAVTVLPSGSYSTIDLAFRAAKRLAGKRARFGTRGIDRYYAGHNGTAWISR